jgi:hypothetical protein
MAPEAPLNPFGLILLWAIWGAIADFRYRKRGGVKPTHGEWRGLGYACALGLGLLILLGALGATARAEGSLTALVVPLIFGLWEFSRWRIRRQHAA